MFCKHFSVHIVFEILTAIDIKNYIFQDMSRHIKLPALCCLPRNFGLNANEVQEI
jgi:hypothetical protein